MQLLIKCRETIHRNPRALLISFWFLILGMNLNHLGLSREIYTALTTRLEQINITCLSKMIPTHTGTISGFTTVFRI